PTTPPRSPPSLHDALPIFPTTSPAHLAGTSAPPTDRSALSVYYAPYQRDDRGCALVDCCTPAACVGILPTDASAQRPQRRLLRRSEEHTSELQSRENLVCR